MLKKFLQNLSALIQKPNSSFMRHNSELVSPEALEKERVIAYDRLKNDYINDPELKTDTLLAAHPQIKLAVDVGSGAGWGSAALSKRVEKVIALEPSLAGINIAKTIFPANEYPNITWVHGFSENTLPTLKLEQPTIFFTGCVLSHLRDTEVTKICQAINAVAPAGSIFTFSEGWGDEPWHQLMWHIRTKDWWQEQFPGWDLNFHGPVVNDKDTYKGVYHKGIWGVKK